MTDSGLLLCDKPQGWTSHQVVGRCRRLMGTRKVGHAGTLDPMATGLLIVGVNRATRLLGLIAGHDKTYTATIRLGEATTTDDAEGETLSTADASHLDEDAVAAGIAALTGTIQQVPSSVSAIKVNGQRAYALVRAGEEVELKSREVTISRFEVLGRRLVDQHLDLDVVVDCTSGTYIRALARDLGASLGVGGHLTALRRTRIGAFALPEHPVDLEAEVRPELLSMGDAARAAFACLEVDAEQAAAIRVGRALDITLPGSPTALLDAAGELLALHETDPERPGRSRPIAVLAG